MQIEKVEGRIVSHLTKRRKLKFSASEKPIYVMEVSEKFGQSRHLRVKNTTVTDI